MKLPRLFRDAATVGAALVVFTFVGVGAKADMVLVEPDAVTDGADLTYAFPGVVLTVDGEPDRVVRAAVGFSDFNGRNIATTGVMAFSQDPAQSADGPLLFDSSAGTDPLRADFLVPTDYVQIDMACDDDVVGNIRAYDALDNLLTTADTVVCDGRTTNDTGTAVVGRINADIAYIIAGGINEPLFLDNLQVNLFTPTCEIQLSEDVYFQGDNIAAASFRLTNTSSAEIPVEIETWIVHAGMEPKSIAPLRKKKLNALAPGADEDFGPLRLARVGGNMPAGPGEIVCRLIDPRNGGTYDTEAAFFEIQ